MLLFVKQLSAWLRNVGDHSTNDAGFKPSSGFPGSNSPGQPGLRWGKAAVSRLLFVVDF